MFVRIGRGTLKSAVMWPLVVIVMMAPYIVLVEAGIAGYRGFVGPKRYVSVAVVTVGVLPYSCPGLPCHSYCVAGPGSDLNAQVSDNAFTRHVDYFDRLVTQTAALACSFHR